MGPKSLSRVKGSYDFKPWITIHVHTLVEIRTSGHIANSALLRTHELFLPTARLRLHLEGVPIHSRALAEILLDLGVLIRGLVNVCFVGQLRNKLCA